MASLKLEERELFLRNNCVDRCNYERHQLRWAQFGKLHLPEGKFTFWQWFHATIKVTADHMKDIWTEIHAETTRSGGQAMVGFISKVHAEIILKNCPIGTFLLRFSDSELGGVTIACIHNGKDGRPEVDNVIPYTSKNFAIEGLAKKVMDHENIQFPDIPKERIWQVLHLEHEGWIRETKAIPHSGGRTASDSTFVVDLGCILSDGEWQLPLHE